MRRSTCLRIAAAAATVMLFVPSAAADTKDVPHPFILWSKQEAAALKKRIESDPLARKQYERMKTTDVGKMNPTLMDLFDYLVMGDQAAGDRQKKALLGFIGKKPEPLTWNVDLKALKWNEGMPSAGDRHMRDEQTLNTLRYDVLYDRLSPAERKGVEQAMKAYVDFHLDGHKPWHPAFKYDRTSWLPNMHWPRAIGTHLMAVALKDESLVEAMFNSQGGWKWFFDEYIADGRFYMEEFNKYYSNIGTMLMCCEALERLGLGRYGYGYTGAGGATMRRYVAMPIWIGFPRLDAPEGGMPRYAAVCMGDAGSGTLIAGYDAKGKGGNRWWSTSHMNGPLPKLQLPGWFEIAHRRWPDDGFDYFLAQLRAPGENLYLPSLFWGVGPIDPKRVKPPAAPSYVTRERGFALLRAEEGPDYWESPKPAVALQFGMYYVHYVHDCFSLLQFVAHNRMIYERMGKGTKKGYAGGDEWRDHVRGHCGVVVDGLQAKPIDDGNHGTQNERIRDDLGGSAKFAGVRASGIYPDVDQERAMVLTDAYLFDVFRLTSLKPRVYDWQVLAHGHLQGLGTPDWKPVDGRPDAAELARPHLEFMHVLDPGEKPWSATVLQGLSGSDPKGVGVRVSALGEPGTRVLGSKPPGVGETGSGVSLLITRKKPATTFDVLHEPLAGGKPAIGTFQRIAQTDAGLGVVIRGAAVDDRILLALGDACGTPQTLEGGDEAFTFVDHAVVRIAGAVVEVTGDLRAMKVRVAGSPKLVINGRPVEAAVTGGCLVFGQ